MKRRYFTLFIICISVFSTYGQTEMLSSYLQQWVQSTELEHASIGITVLDSESGVKLVETMPQLSLVPASTLKILTSAAALDMLGSNYHFETKLCIRGKIDTLTRTLFGDVIIVGGGDPALGSMYFKDYYQHGQFIANWAKEIQKLGIQKIEGKVIADASIYEQQMIPNTWIWEDLGNYYGAGACGLSIFDNLYEIIFATKEADAPAKITGISWPIPNLEMTNEVTAANNNRDMAYVFGSPFDTKRVIRGTIPANKEAFKVKASIPDPSLLAASLLNEALITNNIAITEKPEVSYQKIDSVQLIDNIISPPLKDIIKVLNQESVNLFAEHLCKHLAFIETGKGSTKAGIEVIKNYWKNKGINTEIIHMVDGSGLSRFNAITSTEMAQVLFSINQSQYADIFKQSLPTVGGNGTLYVFSEDNFPNGTLKAKSGSMTRVRCYAGFLTNDIGEEKIFAILLNNFSCSQAKAIDKIEEFLVFLKSN